MGRHAISPKFLSNLFDLIANRLTANGFQKRKPDVFTKHLSDESLGWLGLNRGLYREGIVQINPVVGVRHQGIERLVAECSGIKAHEYIPPSISTNLGYLMPEMSYAAWSFDGTTEYQTRINGMVASIMQFGVPFMQAHSTITVLHQALLKSKRGVPPDQLDYRIAAASFLLGQLSETEAFLDTKLVEIDERKDAAAEYFRRFAKNLRQYLHHGHSGP